MWSSAFAVPHSQIRLYSESHVSQTKRAQDCSFVECLQPCKCQALLEWLIHKLDTLERNLLEHTANNLCGQ